MTSLKSLPDGYRAVDLPADQRDDGLLLDTWAFPTSHDDDTFRSFPFAIDWSRARGVRTDDGELVAMHASYAFTSFRVPGARLPVAGLTWVGVHPGHRRRGLLRSMIAEHARRSLDRGEPVSALFAAEPGIYGRFGYGLASQDVRVRIPRGAQLRDVPGADAVRLRVARTDPAAHGDLVHRLHDAVDRPGWAARETAELRETTLADPSQWRDGAESSRIVLAERDGEPVGYALFRRKPDWGPTGPCGTVRVRELVAGDPAAARALWGFLLDLDLMSTTEAWVATDDVVLQLLVDLRACEPRTSDNLWVRVLDVPAALAGRRYAAPADVVLEVRDELLPDNAGRWRLTTRGGEAEVSRTDRPADLVLDVRELGAAYLGGTSLAALAAAGLVEARDAGALAAAATAFGWPVAPRCGFVF